MSYESTAYSAIRQQCLRELGPDAGFIVPNGSIGSIAAGSITSTNFFQDTGKGTGQFNGWGFFRPGAASSADYWRPCGDLTNSTGLLAHRGANYADTTVGSEVLEMWNYLVRPDMEILDAVNQALKEEYITTMAALSHLSDFDGGMELSTDTNWTDVGSPGTSAKATTNIRTPWGPRSYHLINASANEGTRSTAISISSGRQFSAFAIASTNVGTSSFQAYDSTNSTTTGMPSALTTAEQQPQLFVYQYQSVPTTTKKVALNMLNTSASGDTFWDGAWLYRCDDLKVNLPSYVSEDFKAVEIIQAVPYLQTAANVFDAGSMRLQALTEGVDYRILTAQNDANPYSVLFASENYFQWPLFVQARRPAYDVVASGAGFSAETDTFPGSLKTFIPRCMLQILDRVYLPRFGAKDPKWAQKRQEQAAKLAAATAVRPVESVARKVAYYAGPAGRM